MATLSTRKLNKARHQQAEISKKIQEAKEKNKEWSEKNKEITKEEHEERLKKLKELGLIK